MRAAATAAAVAIIATLALVATTASAASGIDYRAMMGAPRVTRLADGHIRYQHALHRVFTDNATGKQTYTHIDADAEIHERWQFVQLADYAVNGPVGVARRCHAANRTHATISILARDPAARDAVVAALRKPFAVVTADGLRCGGRGILGHVATVTADPEAVTWRGGAYARVRVHFRLGQLEDFFRHAKVRVHTDHYVAKAYDPADAARILQEQDAAELGGDGSGATAAGRRGMRAQGWFHHLTHHIEHDIHHAAHDVKKAADHVADGVKHAYDHVKDAIVDVADDVEHFAQEVDNVVNVAEGLLKDAERVVHEVVSLAEGNFDTDHTWTLAHATWGDAALATDLGAVAMPAQENDYSVAHYGQFGVHFHFELDVHHYRVENLVTTIEGDATLAFAIAAKGLVQKTWSKQVADVRLPSINFAIGPVPVHIQPYIPVVLGATIDASAEIVFGVRAEGSLTYGFQYSGGHFKPIAEHSYSFTKHFSEPQSPHLSITASITPSLVLNIDFLGGPIVTIRGIGACNLEPGPALIFTAQPVVELSAVFELRILGHTILGPKTLGPYKHDGTVYHLGTVHLPKDFAKVLARPASLAAGRRLRALAAAGDDASAADAAGVDPVHIGTVWRGDSSGCRVTQKVSLQLMNVSDAAIDLMAVISQRDSVTGAFATAVVPYVMRADAQTGVVTIAPRVEQLWASTSAADLPVDPPSFEAAFVAPASPAASNVTALRLTRQVGGLPWCGLDSSSSGDASALPYYELSSAVAAGPKDAPSSRGAGGSANANESAARGVVAAVAGGLGGLVVVAAVAAAFIVRRHRRAATEAAADVRDEAAAEELCTNEA